MHKKPLPAAFVALILTLSLFPLRASAAAWPAVEELIQGGIRYVNGGFGVEEREIMPGDYSLKIVFATSGGHYLSDVDVVIHVEGGEKIFSLKADNGPWLLVDLPHGRYRLEATHNGHRKVVPPFSVPEKGTKEILVSWPLSQVDMGLEN